MKKLFRVALVAGCMLLAGSFAKAQSKIGYIAFDELISGMPEAKTVNTQLQTYQKQFTDQMQTMYTELQNKGQAYEKNRASMTDAARTAAETELQDLNKRLQDYQNNSQQQVQAKSQELSKPIFEKARTAVTAVAKEKGYTYVIDSSQTSLIVSPAGDNLMAPVKLKLGLK
ncbi:OmpH family outer membrane protein [Mucilaginibacter sp. Bleaf8]|uniref:OmpH family outer membrane protein n=1 Tax=Mucilaginibacter sp. Bleaf8 TaxID=2834430 RepID=UPI001BCFF4DF|nr:OmpH family outer membrane protein [Mucilaginibacter sp. Bleaf8]MBS7564574.1 OmpH family outer membrane protein [Mucilaginibacter sp. Bleaf8]